MAIPKISKQYVIDAMKYIDENGVPPQNASKQYEVVTENGKKYPPKYLLAVADYLANGNEINADSYAVDGANSFFRAKGYKVDWKQEKYVLTITADGIISTNDSFSMDDLSAGDYFKPLDAYFKNKDGEIIHRKYNKNEKRNTNQTLPRLTCQLYEKQLSSLSEWDREQFPICKYAPEKEMIKGIYLTLDEYKKKQNAKSIEYFTYSRENGPQFVIYCWNIFSTLYFIQECLKRFGNEGDSFTLVYRDKTESELKPGKDTEEIVPDTEVIEKQVLEGCTNDYSKMLLESKNIIFHGAPGTGKSYLAKEIAADIISNGYIDKMEDLSDEQKQQVEFVQFHPSYDYTDFVEGLRPKKNEDGSMGFELQDGIFKKFADKARKNYEDSLKSTDTVQQEESAKAAMSEFFAGIEFGVDEFQTIKGNTFTILSVDDKHIEIAIPGNATANRLSLNTIEVQKMLEADTSFEKISDITKFFGKQFASQAYSYDFAIYKAIQSNIKTGYNSHIGQVELKNYIFIIDEINRGEISKILGELFYSIDPGYRGVKGEISTQYANMHENPTEKFYIPENLYIIGTMNDIDRSVDSFDFAMRRRFRFVEIKAEDTQDMLEDSLKDEELKNNAIQRMNKLNAEIAKVPDLNENYQIGASYFRKLQDIDFDMLWTDYLKPLLQEYVRGMYEEEDYMKLFAKAYGYNASGEGDNSGTTEN